MSRVNYVDNQIKIDLEDTEDEIRDSTKKLRYVSP